ncbi:adenylate/guanylate cyclase domain-containing protein [Saccharobesus litoralis]|uniref:Adenylate/guanylate cyclase domain-containing protein n=1 Tax=Saccharobesus litoralis TaxID=2172099 RepID=A0A2S0VSC0_9ALTE|nr:adenylate/guanylate cyclase domain-containing protein [Saccharobesus litoralis]AWB67000.1 adenylate/guanylate cyclase domain-containing protein [Saccharobesus litoralis]
MLKYLKLSFNQLSILTSVVIMTLLIMMQSSMLGEEATTFLKRLDGMLYDVRLKATLEHRPRYDETKIVIIDLDEKALKEHGRWPWSRRKVADLINKLLDAGVIVIAFDVLFAEPERNPVDELANEFGQSVISKGGLGRYRDAIDGDLRMAEALQNGDVVLGILFEDQKEVSKGILPDPVIELSQDVPVRKTTAVPLSGYIGNISVLHEAAYGKGFFNAVPDEDGSIRRAALLIRHEDEIYPSLALEAARLYSLADTIKVDLVDDWGEGSFHSIRGVRLNDKTIYTDQNGRVLIPYRGGSHSFKYISAADVLSGEMDPEALLDSIVFVGTSSVGLADLRETPVGIQYPGVEVHANVLEGLLHPDIFAYRHEFADIFTVFYLLIFGLVMAYFFPRLGPGQMALYGGVLVAVTIAINSFLWTNEKTSLPLTTPILLCFFITVINIAFGFFAENNQKKMIKGMFDQYVPPAHIDKMLQDPSAINMDGERRNMSVLFSDIRSFTTISEGLSANELKLLLNRYFSPITRSIGEYNGTIDKYVGDMVMAFWGAPLKDKQHAINSIHCAFDMLKLTAELREEFLAEGWPEVRIGIGINTGDMNVGDMGSDLRKAYTVLGDSVNLGSRLEGLTKFYGVELLVSEFTLEQAKDAFEFRPIDRVKVKGKNKAVAIFEPICEKGKLNEQDSAELAQYNKAYALYLAQDWPAAELAFAELIRLNDKRLVYQVYAERILQLKDEPKQQDWDGSFTHTSK